MPEGSWILIFPCCLGPLAWLASVYGAYRAGRSGYRINLVRGETMDNLRDADRRRDE